MFFRSSDLGSGLVLTQASGGLGIDVIVERTSDGFMIARAYEVTERDSPYYIEGVRVVTLENRLTGMVQRFRFGDRSIEDELRDRLNIAA